ncbi:MAG: redox-sensitive bicupin YhaK (pirin superfamily) [Parvicellaceae bacterium]|jgi:redox-sensitive bicupin YhaK (pirin superfamily)
MSKSNVTSVKPLGFPWETQDPFLFCAHHRDEYPKGNSQMGVSSENLLGRNIGSDFVIKDGFRMYHGSNMPGFPYHPHRGFETITINKEGFVDHSDSLGAAGRFGEGDVQWMTAGKGVQHSEMFPLINEDSENHLEIFQVWLNLPKASKFVEPHFKMLWKENVPEIKETDENGNSTTVNVIAGTLRGVEAPKPTPDSWASNEAHDVSVLTIEMEPNAIWKLPSASEGVNRNLYFYKGESLYADGVQVNEYQKIEVGSGFETELVNGNETGYLLFLQGKPINEPVVQYGPFVMNTEAEIQDAYSDYQKTQFGGWPWPNQEQAHERSRGRFALHADGKEDVIG